jgi:ligand-binding sensor domain-containing protein/serine phosphatase RsbU (regulator of sigma subunit)
MFSKWIPLLFACLPVFSLAQKIVPAKEPKKIIITPKLIPAGDPIRSKFEYDRKVKCYSNTSPAPRLTEISFRNPSGQAIKSPVPQSIKPKVVFVNKPKPVLAKPWEYKDNSIFNISVMDVDQGLSSSYIGSIAEDNLGNLWMGTSGVGANMFDGKNVYTYTEKEGFLYNYINGVFCDSKNGAWFWYNRKGVSRFNGSFIEVYTMKEGFRLNAVVTMAEDGDGRLWFGASNGIAILDGNSITYYDSTQLGTNKIHSLFCDKTGNMWISTDKGVIRYDGKEYFFYGKGQGFDNLSVGVIAEDKKGRIAFGTQGAGIYILDGTSMKQLSVKEIISSNSIGNMLWDSEGRIWLGTPGALYCCDWKQFHRYAQYEGIPIPQINGMYEDNKGNIWAGTWGGGLVRINKKPFINYTIEQNHLSSSVASFYLDKKGRLWTGSNGQGFGISDGEYDYVYSTKPGLPANTVRCIVDGSNDVMWLGSWGGGLTRIEGDYMYNYSLPQNLPNSAVLGLSRDSSGSIWIAFAENGVCRFDGKNFFHINKEAGLPESNSWKVYPDKAGNIWITTWRGGVVKYDGKDYWHYTTKEGLSNNTIMAVFQDNKQRMWFGTNGGGVCLLRGNEFLHFGVDEGLASDKVWSIMQDKFNRLWVSTERGISMLSETDGKFKITNFDRSDGVKGLDYYSNSAGMDKEGNMMWGSGKCVVVYKVNLEPTSYPKPRVFITGISVSDKSVNWDNARFVEGSDTIYLPKDTFLLSNNIPEDTGFLARSGITYSGITGFHRWPKDLVIPFDKNHVTFSFSGMDWGDEHKLRYQFMLSGFDEDWNPAAESSTADYRNLSPGTYHFQVRAVSYSGETSLPKMFTFTVLPPWWRTWWFYSLTALGTVLAFLTFIRTRERALRASNIRLENTVAERTQEVVRQKTLVEQKNKDILDSINYAKRIQASIMVPPEFIAKKLKDSFVLYKPKDIVSGDFYFYSDRQDKIILGAIDCTGHGVPGALMSMVGNENLDRIINQQKQTAPSNILTELHRNIIAGRNRDENNQKTNDGMDASLVSIDLAAREVQFAGAARSLYYFDSKGFHEVKGDRWSVGGVKDTNTVFEMTTIKPEGPASFYIFTDGFADQFGGTEGKKMMTKNFKRLLEAAQDFPIQKQKAFLEQKLSDWQQGHDQVDDILVIGFRL